MTPLAAYVLLFLAVGTGFIFVHLLAGKLIRPAKRSAEKETIYECGEPTIGSAWVQFDLRFYVVALLFVIFDVEVAFFFPWAEVFGKANAIRNSPEPVSARDYNDYASKVLELASPTTSNPATTTTKNMANVAQERAFWEKLKTLTPEELASYQTLDKETKKQIRQMGEQSLSSLKAMTPAQVELLKKHSAALSELLEKTRNERTAEIKTFVAELRKAPKADQDAIASILGAQPGAGPAARKSSGADMLATAIESRPEQIETTLRTRKLGEFNTLLLDHVSILPNQRDGFLRALRKAVPEGFARVQALGNRHRQEFVDQANAFLSALVAAAPQGKGMWESLTIEAAEQLGKLSPSAIEHVTVAGVTALDTQAQSGVRELAGNLAVLALVEIVVFFGVLLVGFAYLWRRGDLAWVRSTAAETQTVAVEK